MQPARLLDGFEPGAGRAQPLCRRPARHHLDGGPRTTPRSCSAILFARRADLAFDREGGARRAADEASRRRSACSRRMRASAATCARCAPGSTATTRACRMRSAAARRSSARCARAPDRPSRRFLPRRSRQSARPRGARAAGMGRAAGLRLPARHAGLRPRGDAATTAGRGAGKAPGRRARAGRLLGAARWRPCHGDGGAPSGGRRWLERAGHWAHDNVFAFHNWWHTALYNLDQGHRRACSRSTTARSGRANRRSSSRCWTRRRCSGACI